MNSRAGPSLSFLAAVAALSLLTSCDTSRLKSPQRLGPPALVVYENEPRLWLLVKQEEQKQRRIRRGPAGGDRIVETRYHFDLQSHDARTTDVVWKKRFLTLKGDEGHSAQARILGQDGDVVWLFVNDQPVAVSSWAIGMNSRIAC